jgi:hypothetical protein
MAWVNEPQLDGDVWDEGAFVRRYLAEQERADPRSSPACPGTFPLDLQVAAAVGYVVAGVYKKC